MKPAKEFEWLVKLRDCKFKKGIFKSFGGCKSDFERCLGISENNNEFRDWFDLLVKYGVLEILERKKFGKIKEVNSYTVNIIKVDKLIAENPIYPYAKKFFDKDRIL